MLCLRAFFQHHRRWALWLIAAALCMKVLVPAGYMVGEDSRMLTIRICADASGHDVLRQIALPAAEHKAPGSDKARADSVCPFSALGHGAIGGTDPILLALAILFLLALGFAPASAPAPRRIAYLRPPLRGPPTA